MHILRHTTIFHPKEINRRTRTFIAISINSFGFRLVSIFIPIFLYLEGYNLSDIALFYIVLFLMRAIGNNIASRVTQDVGPSRSLQIGFVSALMAIASMIALTSAESLSYAMLLVAAVANGLYEGLYYLAKHINVEMITDESNAGQTAGMFRIVETAVYAVAPFIGGVITASLGPGAALTTSFVIILLSLVYVIGEKSESKSMYRHDHKNFKLSKIKYDLQANVAASYDWGLALYAWPLFVFLVVGQIEQVGAMSTISGLAIIPLMFWVAKHSDALGSKFLTIGVLLRAFLYPIRVLVSNFGLAVGVNTIADVGDNFKGGGFMQHYYNRADRLGRLQYTYAMEIAAPFGALLSWLVLGTISLFFPTIASLQIAFVISAFITPLALVFNKVYKN